MAEEYVMKDADIVVLMARAMARADGKNPDDFVNNLFGEPILHWRGYLREAKLQLAGMRAAESAKNCGGPAHPSDAIGRNV